MRAADSRDGDKLKQVNPSGTESAQADEHESAPTPVLERFVYLHI